MKSEDFDRVKVIGRGAFGEVHLVSTGFNFFKLSLTGVLRSDVISAMDCLHTDATLFLNASFPSQKPWRPFLNISLSKRLLHDASSRVGCVLHTFV